MYSAIYLPKLDKLTPTIDSTLLKAVEEAGELARAVLRLMPSEQILAQEASKAKAILLEEVAGELMDVAQVCVTMLFVIEDYYNINVGQLIGCHLVKLSAKGYVFSPAEVYGISTKGNFKHICLPRLIIKEVNLLTTVCKILEELGELTQFLGKQAGASGENKKLDEQVIIHGCALELLDVAQCCFTMMYILAEDYGFNIIKLVEQHVSKLRYKGYCT